MSARRSMYKSSSTDKNSETTKVKHVHYKSREKFSYGLSLMRKHKGRFQVLMIQKRYTYQYNQFVHGHYNHKDDKQLIAIFSKMTLAEKVIICGLNFSFIWHHVWIGKAFNANSYMMLKTKFEHAFLSDCGHRLIGLLKEASQGELVWEMPKGRPSTRGEPILQCAVREFEEETGIRPTQYRVFGDSMVYSHSDEGVKYTNTYFLAFETEPILQQIRFELQSQVDEISDIKWMSLEKVKSMCSESMYEFVSNCMSRMKTLI